MFLGCVWLLLLHWQGFFQCKITRLEKEICLNLYPDTKYVWFFSFIFLNMFVCYAQVHEVNVNCGNSTSLSRSVPTVLSDGRGMWIKIMPFLVMYLTSEHGI